VVARLFLYNLGRLKIVGRPCAYFVQNNYNIIITVIITILITIIIIIIYIIAIIIILLNIITVIIIIVINIIIITSIISLIFTSALNSTSTSLSIHNFIGIISHILSIFLKTKVHRKRRQFIIARDFVSSRQCCENPSGSLAQHVTSSP
jgi:hypothetical protein